MSKTQTKVVSVRDAAARVLKDGQPQPASEIMDRVMKTQGIQLKGKTPRATIRKVLDRSPEFERTAPGTYRLNTAPAPKAEKTTKPKAESKPAGDGAKSGDEFSTDLKAAAKAADAKSKPKGRSAEEHEKARDNEKAEAGLGVNPKADQKREKATA